MAENKVIIYTANDGTTKIDVKLEEETLWLTQAQMCELYQTSKSNVSEHIKHIFEDGELDKTVVVGKLAAANAKYPPTVNDLAFLDTLEEHAVGVKWQECLGFPHELQFCKRFKHCYNGFVGHVTLAGGSKAAV